MNPMTPMIGNLDIEDLCNRLESDQVSAQQIRQIFMGLPVDPVDLNALLSLKVRVENEDTQHPIKALFLQRVTDLYASSAV